MRLTLLASFLLILAASGCAKYEFDVTQPPDLVRHIGEKSAETFNRDPLVYRMQAKDGRLVMLIQNPTSHPITLLGSESTVVDPDGQSHPLMGQTIASGSYIKLILPPMRPRIRETGPSFGVGVGVGISSGHYRHRHFHGGYPYHYDYPYHHRPQYAVVYDDVTNLYWDWEGETQVRLTLAYARGEDFFRHNFTFKRVKM
jgi:hypothetical protein